MFESSFVSTRVSRFQRRARERVPAPGEKLHRSPALSPHEIDRVAKAPSHDNGLTRNRPRATDCEREVNGSDDGVSRRKVRSLQVYTHSPLGDRRLRCQRKRPRGRYAAADEEEMVDPGILQGREYQFVVSKLPVHEPHDDGDQIVRVRIVLAVHQSCIGETTGARDVNNAAGRGNGFRETGDLLDLEAGLTWVGGFNLQTEGGRKAARHPCL